MSNIHNTESKICADCRIKFEGLENVKENFRIVKTKNYSHFSSYCKKCHSKQTSEYRKKAKNKKFNISNNEEQTLIYEYCDVFFCKKCNILYPKTQEFLYLHKEQVNNKFYNRYRCKKCVAKKGAIQQTIFLEKKIYTGAKARAKSKNLDFDIDLEDIIIPEYCPLLNIKLESGLNNSSIANSPSIDRIDNNKGYTKDNIWIISNRANLIKNSASFLEFETIYNNWKRINEV